MKFYQHYSMFCATWQAPAPIFPKLFSKIPASAAVLPRSIFPFPLFFVRRLFPHRPDLHERAAPARSLPRDAPTIRACSFPPRHNKVCASCVRLSCFAIAAVRLLRISCPLRILHDRRGCTDTLALIRVRHRIQSIADEQRQQHHAQGHAKLRF